MKQIKLSLVLLILVSLFSCNSSKVVEEKEYPMFWTWLDYRAGMNLDSVCKVMNETGFDGLILNAPTPDDYRVAIPIAHEHGIEVYAWLWTLNLEHDRDEILKEHPDWFSVNQNGESLANTKAYVDYYKFLCPALPEVREHIKDKIRAYCEVEGLNGIAIDYNRFVDVILPTSLWGNYDVVQDHEYPEFDYGYHPEMIRLFEEKHGYDPREQEDPSDDDLWLQFRCDQITEVANEIAEVVHSYDKVMAASPFPTPAMASKMVRQDWGKWNLDIVFPMIYHNFYTGDVSFISDCTIDNVESKNPNTTLYCGLMANEDEFIDCMDAAFNNGAEGIALFTINNLKSPEIRSQIKTYTDSVRTLRANTADKSELIQKNEVITDPFKKTGIMNSMNMRAMAYLSLGKASTDPTLQKQDIAFIEKSVANAMLSYNAKEYLNSIRRRPNLSKEYELNKDQYNIIANQFLEDEGKINTQLEEPELVDESKFIKKYKIVEENSGVTFDAVFYFYGGVISGWSIEPESKSYMNYIKGLSV